MRLMTPSKYQIRVDCGLGGKALLSSHTSYTAACRAFKKLEKNYRSSLYMTEAVPNEKSICGYRFVQIKQGS